LVEDFFWSILSHQDHTDLRLLRGKGNGTLWQTVPQSILEAMTFMEGKGGVAKAERLSSDPSLTNTIQSITRDLEGAAPLTVKAPSHFLVPMVSMELFVVNTEHPLYARAIAWPKLVKIWAALRTDDVSGVLP
jgi:hypothetical protein